MAQWDMVCGLEYVAGLRFVASADGKYAGGTQLERGSPEGTYILFPSWVIDADFKKTHVSQGLLSCLDAEQPKGIIPEKLLIHADDRPGLEQHTLRMPNPTILNEPPLPGFVLNFPPGILG